MPASYAFALNQEMSAKLEEARWLENKTVLGSAAVPRVRAMGGCVVK